MWVFHAGISSVIIMLESLRHDDTVVRRYHRPQTHCLRRYVEKVALCCYGNVAGVRFDDLAYAHRVALCVPVTRLISTSTMFAI